MITVYSNIQQPQLTTNATFNEATFAEGTFL